MNVETILKRLEEKLEKFNSGLSPPTLSNTIVCLSLTD